MKPLIIFRCACLISAETKKLIREDLKRQIEEGVVVTDISLEYAKTLLPKDCKCEVVLEILNDSKIVATSLKKVPRFFQKVFKKKNKQ